MLRLRQRVIVLKLAEKTASKPQKRKNSLVVAETLDHTKAEEEIPSLKVIAKGNVLHGISAIPVKSISQKIVKNIVKKKNRLSRVAERFVEEREKKSHTLEIIQQGGQSGRNPNALS